MGLPKRLCGLAAVVRRLACKGWAADAIAREKRISTADVRAILDKPARRPPLTGRARPILAQTGTKVRRMHFDEGQDAAQIALALDLDPAKVTDFIQRYTPREAHCRRRGNTLGRPRSAREQAALRSWLRSRVADDDGPPLRTIPVPELLPGAPPPPSPSAGSYKPAEPTIWDEGPANPKVGKVDGTPVRRGKARPRRYRKARAGDSRVKLDLAARQEIRRLARKGSGAAELA